MQLDWFLTSEFKDKIVILASRIQITDALVNLTPVQQ